MILDKVYELEGLLKLRQDRSDLPQDFDEIIIAKAKIILEEALRLKVENAPKESESAIQEKITVIPESQPEIPEEEVEDTEPQEEQTVSQPVKTQEPKSRLRFPINERIRFSRELFNGDQHQFDTTLQFVDSLEDWIDVEDYFYSDLGWDPVNKEVGEFMSLLRHLFTHKS